jgi:hypothetical protein
MSLHHNGEDWQAFQVELLDTYAFKTLGLQVKLLVGYIKILLLKKSDFHENLQYKFFSSFPN